MRISDWSSDVCSSDLHLPVGRKARRLDAEPEAVGHRFGPVRKGFRLLAAIIGAVDLDPGQLPPGIVQLALLRVPWRIEGPAPRLIGPTPDSDTDAHRPIPFNAT